MGLKEKIAKMSKKELHQALQNTAEGDKTHRAKVLSQINDDRGEVLNPEEIQALKKSDERNYERRKKADRECAKAVKESWNRIHSYYERGKLKKNEGK